MFINIIYFCLLLVILYLLYYYYLNTCGCNNNNNNYNNNYNNNNTDDFYNNNIEEFYNNNNYFDLKYDTPTGHGMEKMVCSKSCCSTQWPTSVSTQIKDPKIDMNEYLPTNLNCNDGINDTGCICKKKTI
jgi:hypothetical protein